MPSQSHASSEETAKVYRPSAVWNAGAVALGLPLLLVISFLPCLSILSNYKRTGTLRLSDFIFPIVILSLGSLVLWRARRTSERIYLKVSPSGIEYHSPQLIIQTTWDNVESLITDHLAPALWLSHGAASYISPLLHRELASGRRIPLSPFEYSAYSALAHDLRQYAPHLYSKDM